jgi:hypothetical protein
VYTSPSLPMAAQQAEGRALRYMRTYYRAEITAPAALI